MGQHATIYNSRRWKALRDAQLKKEPLCQYCIELGSIVAANTVDHVTPHRGDLALAFDQGNLQSLCETCHNVHADAKDKGKTMAGCDANGMPLDKNHPWA